MTNLGRMLAVVIFVLAFSIPVGAQEGFTSTTLTITIFADGAVRAEYNLDVDITLPRISVPLLGEVYENLVILDGDENPLDHTSIEGGVIVDTLGSDTVNISYETFDLTNKTGRIWTFAANIPIDTLLAFPISTTIVSINQPPLAISTLGERTVLTLPEGNIIISFGIGVLGTKEHALALINDAETTIAQSTQQGVIVTEAELLVQEARTKLDQGDFSRAEELASNAIAIISQISETANQARASITKAQSDLNKALQEKRTVNLDDAQRLLDEAEAKFSIGVYSESKTLAEQATQVAQAALSEEEGLPLTILFGVVALVVAAAVGILLLLKSRGKGNMSSSIEIPSQKKWRDIDLAKILGEKPHLRLEDQDVIKFIVDSGGEVFESELREKFQLPKTTVWRMGKRLVGQEIVEIVNLRGNNLVRIISKYELEGKS